MKFLATKNFLTNIFFHPLFCSCFWIRDPGWVKIRIQDKHPGSATLIVLFSTKLQSQTNQTLLQSKQIVTSEPDVVESTVTEDWEFILLACDGIWDVMSNQQVCDFILKRLALNMQPENICEELMDRCVKYEYVRIYRYQILDPHRVADRIRDP